MGAEHTTRRKNGEDVKTSMVVILSTWHFTRDNSCTENPTIYPSDCTVQFKYSSTEFQTSTGEDTSDGSGFFFDKHGAIFPFPAFINLMNSQKFHQYIKRCVELKVRDDKIISERKLQAKLGTSSEETFEDFEDPAEPEVIITEEEDYESREANKKSFSENSPLKRGKSSKSSDGVVEGPVKKVKIHMPPPPPPPTSGSRPNQAQIVARISEAVRNIAKK